MAEAYKWFRMAAEQGYGSAQSNLGFIYLGSHPHPTKLHQTAAMAAVLPPLFHCTQSAMRPNERMATGNFQGAPRLPDVKASLLNLPGLNGPGNFFSLRPRPRPVTPPAPMFPVRSVVPPLGRPPCR